MSSVIVEGQVYRNATDQFIDVDCIANGRVYYDTWWAPDGMGFFAQMPISEFETHLKERGFVLLCLRRIQAS